MPEPQAQPKETRLVHWRTMLQSWLHSRKALLLLVAFTIACVALFLGKLNGDQWVGFIKWLVPSYLASNVADSAVDLIKGKSDSDT